MFPPIEPDLPQPPQRKRASPPCAVFIPPPPPPRRRNWLRWLPVLVCAAAIFLASTSLGRPENSEKVFDPVLTFVGIHDLDGARYILRKVGHVAEYTVFALALSYFLLTSPWPKLRRWWFVVALLAVLLYAISDEFHQSFVDERVASVRDVMIDTISGFVVLSLVAGCRKLLKPRNGSYPHPHPLP